MKNMISKLQGIDFKQSDIVRKDMHFEYRSRPCHYMEDVDQWATRYGGAYYNYLYLIENGEEVTPPLGMRSSVPLGGFGAGTVELRADGSLRDWNIFNNGPASGLKKIVDEAMFYVWIKREGKEPLLKTLRTHPPAFAPAIDQITYSGAYPIARLVCTDDALPMTISLYAYSECNLYNEQASATPAVTFSFILENKVEEDLEMSLMFVLPNVIEGTYCIDENMLKLYKEGTKQDSGDMALIVEGEGLSITGVQAESLYGIQRHYGAYGEFPDYMRKPQKENPIDGAVGRMYYKPRMKNYGCLSAKAVLKPHETKQVNVVLAWYFPHRFHAGENLGNYYADLYKDARDVGEKVLKRLPETLEAIEVWHRICYDNTLPVWLQEAMVNSLATIAKTGMWFGDGRWRQWESFSCPGVDPIHIQFYRVMPYAWFFNGLRRSQLLGFAACQQEDGYIQENLGRGTDRLDQPIGRMMGDGCTTFILQVYQDYLWTGDRDYFHAMWPAAKKAVQWQINRAKAYGLPHHLNNTYDWWTFEEKDMVSYNAFLHLASLLAGEKMAKLMDDSAFASVCRQAFIHGQQVINDTLWNGSYYLAWKNIKDKQHPDTLLSDTLYGQLWAEILGLGLTVDADKLTQHLASEQAINNSPYGLKVMHEEGRERDALNGMLYSPDQEIPRDELVWEAGSLDWCALNIYRGGDLDESLKEAEKIYTKWQNGLQDQWDIRDLTTAWNGEPYCNSHYARQLILWAIPLALSGQQYTAIEGKLSFNPRVTEAAKLPFMTPQACGTLEITQDNNFALRIVSGCLHVKALYIGKQLVGENMVLKKDEVFRGTF
ncbi:hypothetical protein HZI73_17575 [Vallitalea pronyensis]|uniref:Glycosyl-hydrolase family 116 catalytic region domain-containing protein n=1 Tax=Vallitalea pronyensis TaxID=1348613 RepID=A0A8J8SHM1_9FIRM|nr:GH116 family glycosyl-hydrolase [Vallitalea pronyensis]QUI23995.1 hypothetical protein HZI73_17575 [Vallitalea pronyensis]